MESKVCMNGLCGATSSVEWKKGWPLRSGELANLCDKCGTAYEQLAFCDIFHLEETGWRECTSCGKRLHCGCLASSLLIELLDSGGIHCINCKKRSESQPATSDEKPKVFGMSIENSVGETQSSSMDNQMSCENNGQRHFIPPHSDNTVGSHPLKHEEALPHQGEIGTAHLSSILNQVSTGSSHDPKSEINTTTKGVKDVYISPVQTNLTISLSAPSRSPNFYRVEERELSKAISSFQQGSRSRHLLPKAPKPDTNPSTVSQIRVARPPVEGRVKNQLLPRYWPRITEQELQQISGDSNATIVPLFEKVLSASDAGRIGRLVLPKACAEAYFPPISQPEGLPLRIQDVKGKEWVFQFRFWPNNNSRMYVLEGVTPCIQSMQLQAGDTVTFSRMDPEGKLLMGFRKASNTIPLQDTHVSPMHNGAFSSERFFSSGAVENLPIMSGYSGLLQSLKGSTDPHLNAFSKHLGPPNGDIGSMLPQTIERKRSRNIGSKSKRLLIDSQDALELKLTWEEVQDMLRPPPTVKPTTVTIEDHEFEEYEDPPVLGKSSIFTARISGVQEQWVSCDNCFRWRRLPADFLLPPKWTCQDNIWDQSRCSCSAPDELSPKELEILLKMNKEYKKRRIAASHRPGQEPESATLDSLVTASTTQNNVSDLGATSVATTTKHPRHRPGCSCIVCIQPPSGKGKHKPTCTCNVCMTVKRRFKTLMMRKKKRQSEREAEIAQRNHQFTWGPKEESEVDSISRQVSSNVDPSENEATCELQPKGELPDSGKGELDLNCRPHREEDSHAGSTTRVSMMSLFKVANLPLETYLKQNGLTSLICEQQASSGSHAVPQATGESEGQLQEQIGGDEDENFEPDESQNSP